MTKDDLNNILVFLNRVDTHGLAEAAVLVTLATKIRAILKEAPVGENSTPAA